MSSEVYQGSGGWFTHVVLVIVSGFLMFTLAPAFILPSLAPCYPQHGTRPSLSSTPTRVLGPIYLSTLQNRILKIPASMRL